MTSKTRLLLVLGCTQRCGSNHLSWTLRQHPAINAVRHIWEHHLVTSLHDLESYVTNVTGRWGKGWDPDGTHARDLRRSLGTGCERFLRGLARPYDGTPRYLLAKSPDARNLRLLQEYLPDAVAVVIVRDGRDVVASLTRSFNITFDEALESWQRAATALLASEQERVPFLRVNYETLFRDSEAETRRILRYLDLDENAYDYDRIDQLPVRGSSTFGRGQGPVSWEPVARTAEFQPIGRWQSWSPEQLDRFDERVGPLNQALGFPAGSEPA
ncbi:MAG: sulfotransferase [Pseudomonadota bacterium]